MSALELTLIRLELFTNFLVPYVFACRLLVTFIINLIIFLSKANQLMLPVRDSLKSFTNHLKNNGEQDRFY